MACGGGTLPGLAEGFGQVAVGTGWPPARREGYTQGVATPLDAQKWFLVLPPEGAARTAGESLWRAMEEALPAPRRKLFDTKVYLGGFDKLLKSPTDDMVVDLLNQAMVVQAVDFEATHVLVLALAPVTAFTSNLLRRNGKVTLHWFYEDFREAHYWKQVLPTYDHFLAIQRGPVEAECRALGVGYHYLPTAPTRVSRDAPKPWKDRRGGLLFVGFPSPYRIAVLEAIAAAGLPLQVAGSGWESYRGPLDACLVKRGWTTPEEGQALLDEAKAALHIPSENPSADRENGHLSPRVFDILASGAMLLCEDLPLVREALRGCAWREFRGPVEAVATARRALEESLPDAASIAAALLANRETVLRLHTYAHRFEAMRNLGPRVTDLKEWNP